MGEYETKVSFFKSDGQSLAVHLTDKDVVYIDYTDRLGKTFKYKSNGGNFAIPYLVEDSQGNYAASKVLQPTTQKDEAYEQSWGSYYNKNGQEGYGTLFVPSLRLKLNLNKFQGGVV